MRITDILTETELDELSLAGVGQRIKKAAGVAGRGAVAGIKGISKAAGYIPGAISGIKQQYAAGKSAGASRFGTGNKSTLARTPVTSPQPVADQQPTLQPTPAPGTPPVADQQANNQPTLQRTSTPGAPPAERPPTQIPPAASNNPFSDPAKLKQSFDTISQELSGGQAQRLKPVIKSIWMQLGGTKIEGARNNKAPVVEFYSKFLGGNI